MIQHCGHVAIIGLPNAGKSTLTNQLVGQKVSIVSPKVQTTRTRVIGIALHNQAQIILIDTPGIFVPHRPFDRAMVKAAWGALPGVDCICLIVDATRSFSLHQEILKGLSHVTTPIILVLNKVDAITKSNLLALTGDFNAVFSFAATYMISALSGEGVNDLMNKLTGYMPETSWIYPKDQLTTLPQRLMAEELTREQVFLNLHQELPYAIHVQTETWEEGPNSAIKIRQIIYVQRTSQKAIILGHKGQQIRAIGIAARKQLESLLGCTVHLFLRIKVDPDWMIRPATYHDLHLDK